jgi:hypothetical protein
MSDLSTLCRSAALGLVAVCTPAIAQDEASSSPQAFFQQASLQPSATPGGVAATSARGAKSTAGGGKGGIAKQIPSVSTGCLKPELMGILRRASSHFGSEVIITSGYRAGRGRSYHAKCMAADVQMAGVSPGTLARYFRGQAGVGGVGTYGHTRSVHVDIAPRKFSWHGRSSRRIRVADACPCCGGPQHGAKSSFACERGVIAPDALKLGNARG